ncbi:MAG TPA: substrate-binding domain-containing protein [Rhizomicrobium sp.]|nr:substrate-binding domain-containing protein [Rhizomicrobium sp.]
MSKVFKSMLLGACAVGATLGALSHAQAAASAPKAYGAGSSLIAPYARQGEDCYATPTDLVTKAVPPLLTSVSPFNYTGTPAFDCGTTHVKNDGSTIFYISTGSGTGINGVYSHDASLYGDVDPNTTGNQFWPSVQYGFSDTSLDGTDVGVYNNGGGGAPTHVGITVQPPGGGTGTYPNPAERYGALVQFPMLVAPVAIAYDPVYKKVRQGDGSVKEYKFRLNFARTDGSGGLRLDADTYCKIFNGQITNWNDPALKTLNGGKSLKDPTDPASGFDVPMQIVGRFESSGTTSIFTRHMAAVCSSVTGNQYADAGTTLPANLRTHAIHYIKTNPNDAPAGETLGEFTLADGSDGVAKYVDFTKGPGTNAGDSIKQGRIGYVGTDYALPGALNNPADPNVGGYALNTASLKNSSGKFIAPTASAALTAFGSLTPPQSDANGHYDAGSADTHHRNNPQDWVEPASKASPLANPSASAGYPIVGTTNFLGYTCLKSKDTARIIPGFIGWWMNEKTVYDSTNGLLAKAGLAPLPKTWRTAIAETFTKNNIGLNLNIIQTGTGQCNGITPGG